MAQIAASYDQIADYLTAMQRRKVLVVQPFPPIFISEDKSILALLTDEAFEGYFTQAEHAAIARLVPETYRLAEGKVRFEGDTVDLRRLLLQRKDDFLIKAQMESIGRDIVIGREVDDDRWRAHLDPVTLAADTFLHNDLYPLVEALFHARTDRGGRGVMGFSMGAMAAYQQGMMHPDQYSVVSSVSGVLDLVNDPERIAVLDGVGYYRDQGYGTSVTDKPQWRGRNPLDLATNLAGVDTAVLSTSGDVCLRPTSILAPECLRYPPARNPAAAWAESIMYRQYLEHANRLRELGVHETHYLYPGVHGAYNSRMYAERLLPLANSVFGRRVRDPEVFEFRSVLDRFSVWGYDVTVRRSSPEFL